MQNIFHNIGIIELSLLIFIIICCGCSIISMDRPAPENPKDEKVIKAMKTEQQYNYSYSNEYIRIAQNFVNSETGQQAFANNVMKKIDIEKLLRDYHNNLKALEDLNNKLQESTIGTGSIASIRITINNFDVTNKEWAGILKSYINIINNSVNKIKNKIKNEDKLIEIFNKLQTSIDDLNTSLTTYNKLSGEQIKELKIKHNTVVQELKNVETEKDNVSKRIINEIRAKEEEIKKLEQDPVILLFKIATQPTSGTLCTTIPQPKTKISKELLDKMEEEIKESKNALALLSSSKGADPLAIATQARYINRLERNYARANTEYEREVTALQSTGVYSGIPLKSAKSSKSVLDIIGVENSWNTTINEGGANVTSRGKSVGLLGLPVYVVKEIVNLFREIFSGESTPELVGAAGTAAALMSE